ncbi:hypothetical protein MCOR14_002990 [Pyricularia oryzae]|nr:hypothetical protein MCOR17_009512 [Pyricularia oryzae]KAI6494156.1 hypothetical protein MCOR13_007597 [Pyricularia oryzae]KAI6641369.1 hypothetical protein MCOR14_002990 [Pyricularia oryzae]
MVATRLSLLSLAAVSSCMFGAFRGEPRLGRIDRRLNGSGGERSADDATSGNGTPFSGDVVSPSAMASDAVVPIPSAVTSGNTVVSISLEPAAATTYPPSTSSTSLAVEYLVPAALITDGKVHITDFERATETTLFAQPTVPAAQAAPAPPGEGVVIKTVIFGSDLTPVLSVGIVEPPTPPTPPIKPVAGNGKKPPALPSKPYLANSTVTTSMNMSRPIISTTDSWTLPTELPGDITLPGLTLPPLPIPTISFGSWVTIMPTTTTKPVTAAPTAPPGSGISYCQASDFEKPTTSYSIIYSTTITWTGDPNEYTAPFPPLITPKPSCVQAPLAPPPPVRYTLSRCNGTDTETEYRTCEFSTTTVYDVVTGRPLPSTATGGNKAKGTTTVLVTDKNPAVVFPTSSMPDYGGADRGGGTKYRDKVTAGGDVGPITTGPGGSKVGSGVGSVPAVPITVSLRPGAVTLNDQVYTDNPALRTQIAHVGGEWFTIEPTRVVGAGTTLNRPTASAAPAPTTPITTVVGGSPVVISSGVAVVDGTSFSLEGPPTTKVVQDTTMAIGGGGVEISGPTGSTRLLSPPRHTEVVVAGGELVTAIGTSVLVLRGTTVTYGPSAPITKMNINGDEVTVGPSGVTIRNKVLGGTSARESETQYEVVGGATITQVAPSVVIIAGSTYTVGPGASETTVTFGRQTITLGPTGVAVSTMTYTFPLGETPTAVTITPGATAVGVASATTTGSRNSGGGDSKGEEDAAAGLRPSGVLFSVSLFCIASGVLVWVI